MSFRVFASVALLLIVAACSDDLTREPRTPTEPSPSAAIAAPAAVDHAQSGSSVCRALWKALADAKTAAGVDSLKAEFVASAERLEAAAADVCN